MYIAGQALARGYLNQPRLTAEKFIPNPFSDAGERLYRTGDLARYLPDGNLEFLGRADSQVKLRGYRIELGEIEAVLRENPAVSNCLVMIREDKPLAQRLVAYVVADAIGEKALANELRAHLKSKLPQYMVPSAFVLLAELPLTPNGKIDQGALPVPEASPELNRAFVAPQSQTEKALAVLWTELLGLQRVSLHDNFFEVGGNSLLATQMVWKIREAFRVDLTLATLFEYATISQQAELIESLEADATYSSGPAIVPRGREQYRTTISSRQAVKSPPVLKKK